MRVIGGRFRGLQLAAPPGSRVRPTADPVRQALFDALGERVAGARFLDLCAGTGAVGIEALSRGASEAVFVEVRPEVAAVLRRNLARLPADLDPPFVLVMDALRAVARLAGLKRVFDLVYVDPPYASPAAAAMTEAALRRGLVADGGLLIRELAARDEPPARIEHFGLARRLAGGDTQLAFYEEVRP